MNCAVLVVALVVRAPFSTILLVLLKLFFPLRFIICCFQQSSSSESGSRKTFTDNSPKKRRGRFDFKKLCRKKRKLVQRALRMNFEWVSRYDRRKRSSTAQWGTRALESGRICHQIAVKIVALTSSSRPSTTSPRLVHRKPSPAWHHRRTNGGESETAVWKIIHAKAGSMFASR